MYSLRGALNRYCVLFLYAMLFTMATADMEMLQNWKVQAQKLHSHCQKQTGVTEALIHQGRDGNIPNDTGVKCYLHCFFHTIGVIDDNNVVHLEYLMEIFPEETHDIIRNLVEKCGTQAGVDGCDTAFETVKCYFRADKSTLMAVFSLVFD